MSTIENRPWPQAYFVFGGVAYKWYGWFGCQLCSIETKSVPAGTTRNLEFAPKSNVEVKIYTTKKEGFRKYRLTWAVSNSGTREEHSARIKSLKERLKRLL